MTMLKIARYNGAKTYKDKSYYDYSLIDENGYTFSLLCNVKIPDGMSEVPVKICSYKGQAKVRIDVDKLV